ncbi:hypothetical protein [Hoeflea sp.]|uniref:hypothetical protein n=1 Tax=Hoeflea sp. TaxID=1940281 RepID=UPI003B0247A7
MLHTAVRRAGLPLTVQQFAGLIVHEGLEGPAARCLWRGVSKASDVTIIADVPKKTVTKGGRTVETGRLEDFITSFRTARAAVTYSRASSIAATDRLAQPAVERRRVGIGSVTDSADDTARLYLVDKYVTPDTDTTVGVYRTDASPTYR